MSAALNAPTAQILAYSPPVVNGANVSVLVRSGSHALNLAGEVVRLRALAVDLLAHTGGHGAIIPIDAPGKPGPKRGGHVR
ncbi:MAG: hypothetical protein C0518_05490 [Opitutus sp.]|nr:hypothetical protein [Opitutus sp.]